MRHRRRARGPLHGNLTEVTDGDVAPNIGRQVVQNTVRVRDAGVQLGLPVVRLNLCSERVPIEPEPFDEVLGNFGPVGVWISGEVGSIRAGGARELAQVLDAIDLLQLALESVNEYGEFFAEGRWRCRLSVCAAHHGQFAIQLCLAGQLGDHRHEFRPPHIGDGCLHGERVGEVVDVFARAAHVSELGNALEALCRQSISHEVLHSLDVVLRDPLGLGECVDLGLAEAARPLAQARDIAVGQGSGAEQRAFGERDEPLDLDVNAGLVQPRF